jgi:hypothetical protein
VIMRIERTSADPKAYIDKPLIESHKYGKDE